MRLIHYREMKNMPQVTWLAEQYIPASALVLVWAQEESFKSFIAVDLACSVATGVPWLGCVPINDPGPVVYIAAEGQRGLNSRIKAWARRKFKGGEPDVYAVPEPVQSENVPELVDFIERRRIVPRMVVIGYLQPMSGRRERERHRDRRAFPGGL
jgi:hypothetical protein